jgi:hypothetical protein
MNKVTFSDWDKSKREEVGDKEGDESGFKKRGENRSS